MLPRHRESMQSVGRDRRGPVVAAVFTATIMWLSCSSPESFHQGTSLVTGGAGMPADAGGVTGAAGADVSGLAGTGAPAGAAGDGAAGTGVGVAGAGAAGAGAAGTGAAGTGVAGSGAAGTGVAGTGAAGTGVAGTGAAGTGAAGAPSSQTLTLPLTISEHFLMTGGMGDAAFAGSVTATTTAAACAGEPAAANVGACFSISYQPRPLAAGAPSTWAGFFWQFPANNWGAIQPQLVEAGAKAISFYAKGMAGGERLTFKAGGIVNTPSVATPFSDSFTVQNTFTLTTTWTKYSLPMAGVTYGSGVLGGFAWVAEVPNTTPVRFLLHGLVWEK